MEDTVCFGLGLREEEEGKGFAFRARDGTEHSQGEAARVEVGQEAGRRRGHEGSRW